MNKAFYIFQSQALNLGHLSPKDFVAVHLTSFKFNAIHTHTHTHAHTHTHTHTHTYTLLSSGILFYVFIY